MAHGERRGRVDNVAAAGGRRLVPLLLLEAATLLSGIGHAVTAVALPWLPIEGLVLPAYFQRQSRPERLGSG